MHNSGPSYVLYCCFIKGLFTYVKLELNYEHSLMYSLQGILFNRINIVLFQRGPMCIEKL